MRALVSTLLMLVLTVACSGSKAEQLIDAKRDRRVILDTLYAQYGGGALAAELQHDTQRQQQQVAGQPGDGTNSAIEFLKTVGNAVGEVDRAAFELQCETLGLGERPLILNDKAKAFFSTSAAESRCAEVAKLGLRISDLEAELGTNTAR